MALAARLSLIRERPGLLILAACALQLLITVPLAYILNVWQDDAYTLHSTASTVGYAFHEAVGFEQNAPLYFVLVDLWRHIDQSAFFARLFSVLCAAGVVALTPKLAQRYLPSIDARLVTFAVALNPFLIWAALEIRVYALIVLVSALLLLTCYDAFLRENRSMPSMWYFAFWVCVALYTQYYLAFLIIALGAQVFIARRQSFLRFLAASALGTLPFLPLLIFLPGQVSSFKGEFTPPTIFDSIKWLAGILIAHYVLPLQFIGHRKLIYAGLAIIAVAYFAIERRRIEASKDFAPIVIVAAGFVVFVLGTHLAGVRILTRHPVSLLLPAIFAPFSAISFLRQPDRARTAIAWFCLAAVVATASLFATYRSGAKAGDWARVAAYISQHEQAGEPILVFQAENALPFEYYYHGPNRVIAIPRGVDFQYYDVAEFAVKNEAQIATEIPRAAKRIWLIRAGWCASANIAFGCDIVERYFGQHYRVASSRSFYQSSVRLLVRR